MLHPVSSFLSDARLAGLHSLAVSTVSARKFLESKRNSRIFLLLASEGIEGLQIDLYLKASIGMQDDMWPVVRIVGGDLNGSDLILPANLTDDRRSLMVETPIERTPLAAGDHRIHISLNGQQFAGRGPLSSIAVRRYLSALTKFRTQ